MEYPGNIDGTMYIGLYRQKLRDLAVDHCR